MKPATRPLLTTLNLALQLLLGVLLLMGLASFFIYPHVGSPRHTTYEGQVLSSAQAGIKATPENDYRTLDVRWARENEIFPDNMNQADGTIKNSWGGRVHVGPALIDGAHSDQNEEPAKFFYIDYTKVPSDSCVRMATSVAQNFGGVWVNEQRIQDLYSMPPSEFREDEVIEARNLNKAWAQLRVVSN